MKDIMIDLETLGTRSSAMIIQIGACYFDRNTGEIGLGFSANIDPSFYRDKFTVDYDTVKWWFEQSDDARRRVMETPRDLKEVVMALHTFLTREGYDSKIWCHATFDMPILLHTFQIIGSKFPIPYRNMRDIRTLMDLAGPSVPMVREGTHHHALDDAKYQAQYVSKAMQRLLR